MIDDLSSRLLEKKPKKNKKKKKKKKKLEQRKDAKITLIRLHFKPQELEITNKVLRKKSDCVVCRSSESRFLKQKHDNKK